MSFWPTHEKQVCFSFNNIHSLWQQNNVRELLKKTRKYLVSTWSLKRPYGGTVNLLKFAFGIHDTIDEFKGNARDTRFSMCPRNNGIENTEHFLLIPLRSSFIVEFHRWVSSLEFLRCCDPLDRPIFQISTQSNFYCMVIAWVIEAFQMTSTEPSIKLLIWKTMCCPRSIKITAA